MIEIYTYNKLKDTIHKTQINKPLKLSWVRIVDPDPDTIKLVAQITKLPLSELQESFEEEERPKVASGDYLEIIYRAPSVVDNELETIPIYFYIFANKLVTIEKKPLKILDNLANNMSKNKSRFLFKKGFAYFVFYLMDKINDDFLLQIDKIAARIDIYENFSKKDMSAEDIEKLYDQSVTLSFFNQALIANVEVLNSLKKGYYKFIPRKDRINFEELYYNVLQILDTEKIQREALTNLINIHSILTSTRLNEFMKRLTVLALVIAIPTMISGIYGMNFQYIPLADHRYGFHILTALMFILILGFVYVFRKMDWL